MENYKLTDLQKLLMRRDGLTAEEADELIDEAREVFMQCVEDGDLVGGMSVCQDYLGVEDDYIFEIMPI